ncbi:hypothetical protein GKA01_12150 [Gluconobacter kanchanaburiensis NBRC 103587]|uniref:Uncharacterized protein n=1 Tax=Gluconobacter kanchanaburiensis NBRC 103587 TaxID=1307948 RepID=A0A511B6K2_9PROT|nr:hypothetical protein GKA01_12150 [Gluconobacter kanchanaburiensis NBRC 103587]
MCPGSSNFQSPPPQRHPFDIRKIGTVFDDMFAWQWRRRENLKTLEMGNQRRD